MPKRRRTPPKPEPVVYDLAISELSEEVEVPPPKIPTPKKVIPVVVEARPPTPKEEEPYVKPVYVYR